jgi:single-stranded-DNA-specific exonuclease
MDPSKKRSLVFASANWHPGIIGIVASRLADRFCRPAILISLKNGLGKGSGRSIAHFNIYQD